VSVSIVRVSRLSFTAIDVEDTVSGKLVDGRSPGCLERIGALKPRRVDEVERALGFSLDWPELKGV
jgi:hypothetical protein